MVRISEQIQARNQTILILELSESILFDLEAKSTKVSKSLFICSGL